jgi:hypothetical protein
MGPCVVLTGHGETSKSKTYVNYGAFQVLLPTKIGSKLWMDAHNFIVKDLCLAQTSEDLDQVFQKFATQPSSVLVSNLHDPGNISISHQSCQKASERQILLDRIRSIEQTTTESLTSWELLEAKIFPAPDMLLHSCAYTPAKYNRRYICKDLIHPATITMPGFTLDIHVDIEKLARDAATLFLSSEEQGVLSDEHMIYCTPVKSSGRSQHIALSYFLQQILPEIRILCFCKPDRKRIWSENFQLVEHLCLSGCS